MKVFVTGGAGYIGSHALVQLLTAGHEVCVFDNYANGSPVVLARVRQLTNRDLTEIEGDIRDIDALTSALSDFAPDAVIHFAGLKAVGESNDLPPGSRASGSARLQQPRGRVRGDQRGYWPGSHREGTCRRL